MIFAFLALLIIMANAKASLEQPFKLCAYSRNPKDGDVFSGDHRLFYKDSQLMIGDVQKASGDNYSIVFTLTKSDSADSVNGLIVTRIPAKGVPSSPTYLVINPKFVGLASFTTDPENLPAELTADGFAYGNDRIGYHAKASDPLNWWGWTAWPTSEDGLYHLGWDPSRTETDDFANAGSKDGPIPVELHVSTCQE